MKKNFDLFKLFENKRFLTVFALLASILLFVLVTVNKSESTDWTIQNVPVNLDLQTANLSNLRLNIIEGGEHYVDVKINLPRTTINRYNADSPELAITAKISSITEPGTYTLPVVSALNDTAELPFTIVSYSPSTIKVRVDRMKSKTFDIETMVKGINTPPNYMAESESVSPSRVTVSGPEAEIEKIVSAQVSLELTETLDQTEAWILPIELKDAAGQTIDIDEHYIKTDATEAQLAIAVLKETGVPLEVGFQNIPRDFPVEALEELMTMTPDYVRIAGRPEVVERLTEIRLGYIDIKDLRLGNSSFAFSLNTGDISDEIKLLENISTVQVRFDDYNWETQTYNIDNIQKLNEPAEYNVELISQRLDNVQLMGDKAVLESLTADDIVAEVDLFDRELSSGQRSYPVKISVPGKGLVWAVGSYSTVISVERKE